MRLPNRIVIGLAYASGVWGCAPQPQVEAPRLDSSVALSAPVNSGWHAAKAADLARFKAAENGMVWTIGQEMHGRSPGGWPPPAAPIRLGSFEYFSAETPGQRYPIFLRRRGGEPQEIVLDLNREFPTGQIDIGLLRISPDNQKLAVTLDIGGSGDFKLFTRELPEGHILGPLASQVHEAEWGAGGNLIFTTTEGLRATQLLRLRAGSAIETIPLRVKEDGHIAIHPSGAGAVIVRDISPRGGTVWSIDPTSPKIQPNRLTAPPPLNGSTVLDGCASPEGLLLLVERNSARNAVWVSRPGGKAQELPMNGEEAHISGIRCFQQHAVLFGRAENRGALWLVSLGGGAPTVSRIAAPFGLTALTLGAHPSPDVSTVRVQLSSLINPPLLYELDLTTGSFAPKAQMEVARHSAGEYTIAHLSARAPDGVAIPITVAYRVDIERSGTRPVVLSTYGAYGANASTEFDPFYLPLLERGFVVAVAHIRGGGEGGPGWHAAGRGRDKRVSTTDLIACAEALVKLGWGADRRIALIGRSAGAIPAAGAAALRSDLIGAVILDAPFLDVVGALSDPSRPLAVRDRAEWGDPNDPIIRETMRRYAPFDLALTPSYPPTLITTGINDAAVSPLEAARWIEHLERAGSTGHLISISAGSHSGPPTRVEATNEAALRAVFILSKLGSADRN